MEELRVLFNAQEQGKAEGKSGESGVSQHNLARELGISRSGLREALVGKNWRYV